MDRKIPTVKFKVNIACADGTFIDGFAYVPQGLRLIDYFNSREEKFMVITEARLSNLPLVHSFKLYPSYKKKKERIILNKAVIRWVEGSEEK